MLRYFNASLFSVALFDVALFIVVVALITVALSNATLCTYYTTLCSTILILYYLMFSYINVPLFEC